YVAEHRRQFLPRGPCQWPETFALVDAGQRRKCQRRFARLGSAAQERAISVRSCAHTARFLLGLCQAPKGRVRNRGIGKLFYQLSQLLEAVLFSTFESLLSALLDGVLNTRAV